MGSQALLPATEIHVTDAVSALKRGEVIALPTDTLYGLACDACSRGSIQKIYEIKVRNSSSPLAICVGDVEDFERYARVDHLPYGLLQDLLPGPVTLVLSRGEKSELEKTLNAGVKTIGIRIPDCEFVRLVARGFGGALALTSANISSRVSSVRVEEFEDLWASCAAVFDGGHISADRSGSTIVDLTQPSFFKILRPGSSLEKTREILLKHDLKEQ